MHYMYMYVHVFMFYRLNHSCHSKYAKWEHEEYRHVYACMCTAQDSIKET
jgi:hypothetical protein